MIWLRTAVLATACAATGCTAGANDVCAPHREDEIRRVADYTIDQAWDDWGWNTGVTLSGLVAASECTGDQGLLEPARAWLDAQMADGVVLQHVNGIAPGPALLAVHAREGDPAYLELAVELGDLLVDEYPKIDRALEHAPGQLWVDTTFMSAPFLVELGQLTGDDEYTDLGVDQVLVHGDRLQREDGLWHHGWVKAAADEGEDPLNGVMWARGNGWAAASTVEVLERLPSDDPRIPELEARLKAQLETALEHQSIEGGWSTVVDDPATHLEASGTALLARGLVVAHRRGILDVDDPVIGDAFAWLDEQSDDDGRLRGVSGPTVLSSDPSYYADRPTAEAEPYAQGAYLLLLSEPE